MSMSNMPSDKNPLLAESSLLVVRAGEFRYRCAADMKGSEWGALAELVLLVLARSLRSALKKMSKGESVALDSSLFSFEGVGESLPLWVERTSRIAVLCAWVGLSGTDLE
jgi:hypothetical protein